MLAPDIAHLGNAQRDVTGKQRGHDLTRMTRVRGLSRPLTEIGQYGLPNALLQLGIVTEVILQGGRRQ